MEEVFEVSLEDAICGLYYVFKQLDKPADAVDIYGALTMMGIDKEYRDEKIKAITHHLEERISDLRVELYDCNPVDHAEEMKQRISDMEDIAESIELMKKIHGVKKKSKNVEGRREKAQSPIQHV